MKIANFFQQIMNDNFKISTFYIRTFLKSRWIYFLK